MLIHGDNSQYLSYFSKPQVLDLNQHTLKKVFQPQVTILKAQLINGFLEIFAACTYTYLGQLLNVELLVYLS